MFTDTIILALLVTIMIIDIFSASKITLNYQKVYHEIRVAGATGSIGLHVMNTAIEMGHQPVALVRNKRKVKLLPCGGDIFYGDVSMPETLTDLPKDIDAVIFTPGSDGQGCWASLHHRQDGLATLPVWAYHGQS